MSQTVLDSPQTTEHLYDSSVFVDVISEQPKTRLEFRVLGAEHAQDVAKLHIDGISTGFISSLGLDFVTALYKAIIQTGQCFGFVDQNEHVLGFVAFSESVSSLYKQILMKKGIRFGFLLLRKLFRFNRIKRIVETLLYPQRTEELNLPSAELLSIVISKEARQHGFASDLIHRGIEMYRRQNISHVKVMVGAANIAANRLYQKCGFERVHETLSHGIPSNIYVAATGAPKTIESTKQTHYPELAFGKPEPAIA